MKVPLQLSFRNIPKTGQIESLVREKVSDLERVNDHIISCSVAVEKTQEHQNYGNPFRVRIDMTVPPGHELVVKREPSHGSLHQDLETVIRKAFSSARRRLSDLNKRQKNRSRSYKTGEL